MSDFQFREMIRLLKMYCMEVDQHDSFKIKVGKTDWFIDIGLSPFWEADPDAYRILDETAQVEVKKILEVE